MDYDESAIAGIYDEARALTPERLRQWRDVLAMDIDCSRISAIVDLGCGTGRFTQLLATHFQAGVIGIDPSRKMIERARQKRIAGNVVFRRVSAEALPLEDCSVDLVFLSQVYHHLTDPGGSRAGMFPRPALSGTCVQPQHHPRGRFRLSAFLSVAGVD